MPIVTISRGTLSGGEALAQILSRKLGCPAIGLEIIKDAASLYGISEVAISEQLKQGPGIMERLLGEKRRLYLIALQSALLDRVMQGSFVYHGLAGHFLLQGIPTVFKVRLVAPLAYRVKKVKEKKMLSDEEAARYVEKIDEKRVRWTKFLYNVDWTDPTLYDVVINLEHVSLETAGRMIMSALSQPEFQDTPERHRALENVALAARVTASLALNERTRGIHVEVQAQDGRVTIVGTSLVAPALFATGIKSAEELVTEVAQSVPGVTDTTVSLTLLSD